MRKLTFILALALFSSSTVQASTEDIYRAYGIEKETSVQKTHKILKDTKVSYNDLKKVNAFNTFYNNISSLSSPKSLKKKLKDTKKELNKVQKDLENGFDLSVSEIMTLDNKFESNLHCTNFLMKAIDSYDYKEVKQTFSDELVALEIKLDDTKKLYKHSLSESAIGVTKDIIHPVQAPMVIMTEFGRVTNPNDVNKTKQHNGLDFEAEDNTGVVSLLSGVVVYGGYDKKNGEHIIIQSPDNITVEYCNLKERYVKKGDIVNQYQKIATLGTSSRSEPGKPHLHLALSICGQYYDPLRIIRRVS